MEILGDGGLLERGCGGVGIADPRNGAEAGDDWVDTPIRPGKDGKGN